MDEESRVEQEKTLVTWTAKSQPFRPEDVQMKPVLFVIVFLVGIVLVFAREWMLLLVILAGGFYYYANKRTAPMDVEFAITNKGLRAFGRLYLWWELSSWWWEEKWMTKVLVVYTTSGMMGRIYIPIEGVKQETVETIMNKYLEMNRPKETWMDKSVVWVKEKFPLEK